ncbi:unnamed protein product [Caenorhabditis angaria]|uniref:Cilia- and flagella-associated protein 36 n=1 Tax=Caenorhabditis angaria TaxID=860376 RepID=A0A9P1N7U8_9PELO|nr:unnamed protein product [Caenorhabditis angaria]
MLRRFSKKRNSSQSSEYSNSKSESKKLLNKFLDFITSSIWSIPIASFIEQQSIVFDRQQMEIEVYEQIHKEYSSLIDTLIECFCEDVSTSTENLTEALKLLDQKNLSLRQRVSIREIFIYRK